MFDSLHGLIIAPYIFYRKAIVNFGMISKREHFKKIGGQRYQSFLNAGYQDYIDREVDTVLLQKAIWSQKRKLFFINVKVTDFSRLDTNIGITFSASVQYNHHFYSSKPCFNVDLHYGSEMSPEEIEAFFRDIYDKMECEPYDA